MVSRSFAKIRCNSEYRKVRILASIIDILILSLSENKFYSLIDISVVKEEILNALSVHKELLAFDASEVLKLRERHKPTKLNNMRVKGHTLSEKTMQIAVSVINISIYLNPTLSFLIQPAIVVVAVGMEGVELGNVEIAYLTCYFIHEL